jgi:tRNA dimethylallyltransferase
MVVVETLTAIETRPMEGAPRVMVAVVGPTGSGKSELALGLAEELPFEVVSCDALQVYRGLDVGTAKLPPSDRRGVPHHLLDEIEADREFSAAEYVARAVPVIEDIVARGRLPLVVGGTGLYLRALRYGLFEGPGRRPELRRRLARLMERRGTAALHRVLRRWDPVLAARLHPNDRVRLVRGVEVALAAGKPMSELMASRRRPLSGFHDILVGLRPARDVLARRIGARVESMFSMGLVEEARRLRDVFGGASPAFKAIGYREALLMLSGEITEREAKESTARATLRYAKRQMTWFRREPGVTWFDGCGDEAPLRAAVAHYLRREIPRAEERPPEHGEVAC